MFSETLPDHPSLLSHSRHRLIVPHQEFRVLLEDALRDLFRHCGDGGVILFLPGLPETGADRLDAEHV
ncbi:MAG: hypothetical protein UZ16_OP3001000468 [Candidatus Hinthialibacteria bacterium OLB16]|nr:MAG: hypothetical protein UZ16_OP3001000468 [Candidatus Hinthialibacteria bacterium OLB16]